MTAQNLIEILEAVSYNSNVPLDKLEVGMETVDGWKYYISNYDVKIYGDRTIVCLEGC